MLSVIKLVPQVTELVVSQFMWLNYLQNDKPAYVYINSIGNQLAEEKQVYASDHEGFAVVDVMNYIRPEVWTWVLAEASTSAALVAAAGKKGRRYGNPHCRVMTAPPRVNREVAKLPNIIKRANELKWANDTYMELLAQYTGRDFEAVRRDLDRNQFFDVHGAIEYGLLDAVAPLDKIRQMGSVSTTKVMLSQTQGYTGGRGGAREEAPTAADA